MQYIISNYLRKVGSVIGQTFIARIFKFIYKQLSRLFVYIATGIIGIFWTIVRKTQYGLFRFYIGFIAFFKVLETFLERAIESRPRFARAVDRFNTINEWLYSYIGEPAFWLYVSWCFFEFWQEDVKDWRFFELEWYKLVEMFGLILYHEVFFPKGLWPLIGFWTSLMLVFVAPLMYFDMYWGIDKHYDLYRKYMQKPGFWPAVLYNLHYGFFFALYFGLFLGLAYFVPYIYFIVRFTDPYRGHIFRPLVFLTLFLIYLYLAYRILLVKSDYRLLSQGIWVSKVHNWTARPPYKTDRKGCKRYLKLFLFSFLWYRRVSWRFFLVKFFPFKVARLIYFYIFNKINVFISCHLFCKDRSEVFMRFPAEDFYPEDPARHPHRRYKVGPYHFEKQSGRKNRLYFARYRPLYEWHHYQGPAIDDYTGCAYVTMVFCGILVAIWFIGVLGYEEFEKYIILGHGSRWMAPWECVYRKDSIQFRSTNFWDWLWKEDSNNPRKNKHTEWTFAGIKRRISYLFKKYILRQTDLGTNPPKKQPYKKKVEPNPEPSNLDYNTKPYTSFEEIESITDTEPENTWWDVFTAKVKPNYYRYFIHTEEKIPNYTRPPRVFRIKYHSMFRRKKRGSVNTQLTRPWRLTIMNFDWDKHLKKKHERNKKLYKLWDFILHGPCPEPRYERVSHVLSQEQMAQMAQEEAEKPKYTTWQLFWGTGLPPSGADNLTDEEKRFIRPNEPTCIVYEEQPIIKKYSWFGWLYGTNVHKQPAPVRKVYMPWEVAKARFERYTLHKKQEELRAKKPLYDLEKKDYYDRFKKLQVKLAAEKAQAEVLKPIIDAKRAEIAAKRAAKRKILEEILADKMRKTDERHDPY